MIDLIRTALVGLVAANDDDATNFIRTIEFDGGVTFTLAGLDAAAPGYRSATLHTEEDDESIVVFGNIIFDRDEGGIDAAEEMDVEHDGPWRDATAIEQMAAYARIAA